MSSTFAFSYTYIYIYVYTRIYARFQDIRATMGGRVRSLSHQKPIITNIMHVRIKPVAASNRFRIDFLKTAYAVQKNNC